jgi:hypothetical protein
MKLGYSAQLPAASRVCYSPEKYKEARENYLPSFLLYISTQTQLLAFAHSIAYTYLGLCIRKPRKSASRCGKFGALVYNIPS